MLLYKPKGYLYRRTDTQLDCKWQSKEACGGWQTSWLSFRRVQWRKLSRTTIDTDNSGWNKLASLQKRFLYALSTSQYTCRILEPFIYLVPHTVHALEVIGSCHHPRHALPASKKPSYTWINTMSIWIMWLECQGLKIHDIVCPTIHPPFHLAFNLLSETNLRSLCNETSLKTVKNPHLGHKEIGSEVLWGRQTW